MNTQTIDTPTELDDRDLDLVAGGNGSGGGGFLFVSNRGNQSGLINFGLLNGSNLNVLGFQSNFG
jgi:hypothetical protein